jgi:hypothetical protein
MAGSSKLTAKHSACASWARTCSPGVTPTASLASFRRTVRTAEPSLFFGRNEECGLRCVYHGSKWDTAGNCIDMPNEPVESNFKDKVKALSYRAADWGGLTWIYMGPDQGNPPGLPEHVYFLHSRLDPCIGACGGTRHNRCRAGYQTRGPGVQRFRSADRRRRTDAARVEGQVFRRLVARGKQRQ